METTESRLPLRLWLIFAIVVLICLSGCGSGLPNPPPDNRPSDEDDQFTPAKHPPTPGAQNSSPAKSRSQSRRRSISPSHSFAGQGQTESRQQRRWRRQRRRRSEVPSLPAVLSQWKEADFLLARDKADPRLAQAVEQLAKHPRSTAAEAEMLASLLKPQTPARSDDPAQPARNTLTRARDCRLGRQRHRRRPKNAL